MSPKPTPPTRTVPATRSRQSPPSSSRPRRSPRFPSNTNPQPHSIALNSNLAPRSLFTQNETPHSSTLRESDDDDDDDELGRLASGAELSGDDDFPPPPASLPLPRHPHQAPLSKQSQQVRPTIEHPTQPPPSFFDGSTQPPLSANESSTQPPPSTFEGITRVAPPTNDGTNHTPSGTINLEDRQSQQAEANDAILELEKQNDLRRLYVHLKRIKVYDQKAISSAFNIIQQGTKDVRAKRIFLVLSVIMERTNRTGRAVLEEKGLEKGKDFMKEYNRTMTQWGRKEESEVVPEISELEKELGMRQRPRSVQADRLVDDESEAEEDLTAANHVSTGITLEEFARLMIIFRDVPEAAADLRKSGQDLSREDLDTGRTRNSFWTDRIQGIFNDRTFITNERLDPPLQDIDPGRPLTEVRDGFSLQDLFAKFRKEFTDTYRNWDVSGNMEHSTFINFCRLPGMKTLSRSGARCLVAFRIFGFGTANQNTLLLDFCSKQMADASGARLESGVGTNGNTGVTSFKAKKRISDDSIQEDIRTVLKGLSGPSEENNPAAKRKKTQLDDIQLQRARREDDKSLMQTLMETHEQRVKMNHPVDNRVTTIVDNYYHRLVEDAAKRMQLSNANE